MIDPSINELIASSTFYGNGKENSNAIFLNSEYLVILGQQMRRPKAVNDISSSGNDDSVDFKVEMLEKEVNKLKLALFDLKHGK